MKKDIVFRLRPLGPSLRASTSPPQLLLARRETRRKLKDLHSVFVCVIYAHSRRTRFPFFVPRHTCRCALHAPRFVTSFIFNFLLPLASVTGDFPPSGDASGAEQRKKLFPKRILRNDVFTGKSVLKAWKRCRAMPGERKRKRKQTRKQIANSSPLEPSLGTRRGREKKRNKQPSDSLWWRRRRPISKSRPAELAANARPTWAPLLMKSASR